MERAREADKFIGNGEVCRFGKVVICDVVLFPLSRLPLLIVVGSRKCNAVFGCCAGVGCREGGHWGGCNRQRFGEDADCIVGTIVRGKCNKLHCVLRHYASGVGVLQVGRCDNNTASDGEARGGQ
jgi:hypothetical protein